MYGVTLDISRVIEEISTHAASIPTPLAPEDSLKIARRSHARTVPQHCEIVEIPPSACVLKRPCGTVLYSNTTTDCRLVYVLLLYTKASHKHTPSSANSFRGRPGNSLWTRSILADSSYVITDSRTLPRGCVWRRVKQRLK